mgnify:FL=1
MRNEGIVELYAPRRTLIGRDGITKIPHFLQRLSSKCVLVVTDKGLIKVGTAGKVTAVLDNANIQYVVYDGVEPNPTTRIVYDALHFYQEHQCDAIIAIGGGSPIDVAKAVSILSANGGKIQDYNGYNKSKKRGTPIIAVNTTAGTGSECTPFTIISDANTGMKWPLIGYEMMPEMAIVDADNMMKLPPRATQASGYDVLTHAVEAYVSTFATEYTNGMCRDATKMVFDYLPRAYYSAFRDAKPDPVAREKMANASALAGIAFANAFLGINHSLSHKLGGWFHIPHGTANALLFPFVCRFNAQRHPYKMGTFSQYKYPQAFERYVELGELIGVKGKTDEQTFENWIKACEQLKKDIDIPETILDWLLEAHPEKTAEEWEAEFLAAVDQMSEWAFHDACTGCNPVYPTIAELKGCYLKAFYGEKKYAEKYGDIWEVPVTLPTDTHAAYPMGLCADLGVEKTGGFN